MQSRLNPYLAFNGNAREVMEFYSSVFGGQLHMSTYKEGGMTQHEADADKIMHAMIEAPNGMVIMAGDMPSGMPYQVGTNMSISLSGDNEVELRGYFEKLSAGGKVHEPLKTAPWGDTFGMFADKFGVEWLVNISGKKA